MIDTNLASAKLWQISKFKSLVNGINIRCGFQTPKTQAKRAILLLNGRSEWIEKYSHLPSLFNLGNDVIWISLDHRGQGDSEGPRAYVEKYADYAQDAASALEILAKDLPYAIISHSMGGLIALIGTLFGYLKPQALALSSPLLGLPKNSIPHRVAKILASAASHTKLRFQSTGFGTSNHDKFECNPLTSSPLGFQLVANSPFPFYPVSFGWANATFNAFRDIHNLTYLSRLNIPIRMIGGTQEAIVDPQAWIKWCKIASQVSSAPVDFLTVDNGRHELFNETLSIQVQSINLIQTWLNQNFIK